MSDAKAEVAGLFRRLGVPRDAHLLLHSAFSGLGRQGFDPRHLLQAMTDHLDCGTLLLPTMTWRTVNAENPVFDTQRTPSHTGILTEIFRTSLATHRSLHPTHSVAAWGVMAETLTAQHHQAPTPVSAVSPFARLAGVDGLVMMLGVGLETCTLMHHAEEVMAPDIYLQPDREVYDCLDAMGRHHDVTTQRHRRLPREFPKFTELFIKRGILRRDAIAGVDCLLIRSTPAVMAMIEEFDHNPYATINRTPPPE